MKVPVIGYDRLVRVLVREGWIVIRQRGSHIRLERLVDGQSRKLTVPAHKPIKRSTLASILKSAELTTERLLELL